MIRDELSRALEILGDRLPGGRVVVLVRRAFGDRGVTFIRGDVEGVTGLPPRTFEAPVDRWAEALHPDDRDRVLEKLARLPEAGPLRLEYRIQESDRGTRWLREELTVRRSSPGAPPEVVGLLTDVTFQRTARARISRLEKEVWGARKLESVGEMATGVAHDFNNLLTVVLAAADMLRHEPDLPPGAREDVKAIREAATRGSDLVEQILTFAARRPKHIERVDVAGLVEGLVRILQRAIGDQIHLDIDVPDDCWPVEADRAHVEQILFNLASNARDAMHGEGALRIAVRNEAIEEEVELERGRLGPGRYVCISVEDTGEGVDAEVRARLFEPLFSTKSRDRGPGGGFGLATVLRLVQGYGGAIGVKSEPGGGTAFRIYLPVREKSRSRVTRAVVRGAVAEPRPGKGRILLVGNDEAARNEVARILERAGHAVVACATVEEGLQVFDRVRPPFDLVVTEVMLPDRSGVDLARAARRRVPELPVIYLSRHPREKVADRGLTDPDDPLLRKPVPADELEEVVRRALGWNGDDRPDTTLPEAGGGGV